MKKNTPKVPEQKPAGDHEVDVFLQKMASVSVNRSGGRGRLLFALDATASRQPTWDKASRIQAEMFQATGDLGGLDIQLAFYRGFGQFMASPWLNDSKTLLRLMGGTFCMVGETQIRKVLRHAINETHATKVNALVFVGDMVEESVDQLGAAAGELGLLGVPAFMFHEGNDPVARFAFEQIARLTGGACCRFDPDSPRVLADLLKAVAVYAAGGRPALENFARRQGGVVLQITSQVRGS